MSEVSPFRLSANSPLIKPQASGGVLDNINFGAVKNDQLNNYSTPKYVPKQTNKNMQVYNKL